MRILAFLVLGVCLLIGNTGPSQTGRSKVFKKLMQKKLDSSKNLLEGLALNDFKKLEENATTLLKISSTADWFAYKTREYELFSNEFRRAAEKLKKKAKEENLDGAALAYVELTMSCIRCHQYVREMRDVRFEDYPKLQP